MVGGVSDLAIDLVVILDMIEAFLKRFVVIGPHQLVAATLWVAHTYTLDAFDVTPRLAITSPGRRTGKTRFLEVLGMVVKNPMMTSSVSPSVLFRTIDVEATTVLFDEVDAVFGKRDGNEDLRALLNAGFQRGGKVHRSEPEGRTFKPKGFNVFAPVALAAIGTLPDTVADRSIHERMKRRTAEEKVERFRRRLVRGEADEIRSALGAWAPEAIERLREAWPVLPDDLDDRAADSWEPLLAISDAAGHGWDGRARAAALALARDRDADEESVGTLLLGHIRDAFGDRDRVTTAELLEELVQREDAPWPAWWAADVEAGRTKGPGSRLAKILKPYGIKPKVLAGGAARGYERDMFADPWSRYVSPNGSSPLTPEKTSHVTRNPDTVSDLRFTLLRLPGEEGEVTSVVQSGCAECGGTFGHMTACSRSHA
jgi:hypothetical protein